MAGAVKIAIINREFDAVSTAEKVFLMFRSPIK